MKSVIELTVGELAEMATTAWREAAERAISQGLPITGTRDGRRIRYFPDGRIEDLGPVSPLPENEIASRTQFKRPKSVA